MLTKPININPLVQDDITEEQLKNYVLQKDAELETDFYERVSGIKNLVGTGKKIAGYEDLRRFFDGDHWSFLKEDGTPIRVYNYCRTTVRNYVSFIANEPPEDDVPPRDPQDEIEVARAEEVEKLLREIKEDNNFPVQFIEACQNQSLLGDAFIFGPYIEWIRVKEKFVPRIRFKNIKRVENVRILWSDEDWTEYDGFIFHYRISVKRAEKIYEKQLKERGIDKLSSSFSNRYKSPTGYEMLTIKIYWDDKYMLTLAEDKVIDFVKHDWGFVPGIFVKNQPHPTRPWGISDIEDILDAQVEYNETACETRGKIKQVAIPHIFYAGEGAPVEYNAGQAQMIKIGPEDRIFPDPMGQSTAPFDVYLDTRKNDIHQLSMISEIFYGSTAVARATGRALSVLMQGVNNTVKIKQQYWINALKKLNANILRLVEKYTDKGKLLVQGYYVTDIFFPSVLVRNVTEEINKFNMKLQSQYTTMKNIGIPSPKEEQKVMKKEWEDTSLMLEISRLPQLRLQLQQMLQQVISSQGGGLAANSPILTEGEGGAGHTAEEELPMASPNVPQQSPTTGEGAVALKGFRGK